jgi:hypothetical protein
LANNVKKLQSREDEYRLRVGDRRVIFSQDGVASLMGRARSTMAGDCADPLHDP